jgi:hypothetical protein
MRDDGLRCLGERAERLPGAVDDLIALRLVAGEQEAERGRVAGDLALCLFVVLLEVV